jgi:hypothetical protein
MKVPARGRGQIHARPPSRACVRVSPRQPRDSPTASHGAPDMSRRTDGALGLGRVPQPQPQPQTCVYTKTATTHNGGSSGVCQGLTGPSRACHSWSRGRTPRPRGTAQRRRPRKQHAARPRRIGGRHATGHTTPPRRAGTYPGERSPLTHGSRGCGAGRVSWQCGD